MKNTLLGTALTSLHTSSTQNWHIETYQCKTNTTSLLGLLYWYWISTHCVLGSLGALASGTLRMMTDVFRWSISSLSSYTACGKEEVDIATVSFLATSWELGSIIRLTRTRLAREFLQKCFMFPYLCWPTLLESFYIPLTEHTQILTFTHSPFFDCASTTSSLKAFERPIFFCFMMASFRSASEICSPSNVIFSYSRLLLNLKWIHDIFQVCEFLVPSPFHTHNNIVGHQTTTARKHTETL